MAELDVKLGMEAEFESAVERAQTIIIATMREYSSHRLGREFVVALHAANGP